MGILERQTWMMMVESKEQVGSAVPVYRLPDTYLSGYYDKSLNSFCILQELFSLQVRTS